MKKTLVGWVIYGIILPSYIGIIMNHYKDPYEPTSIMECHKGFDHCPRLNRSQVPLRLINVQLRTVLAVGGVGGLAVGLALQNLVQNLISGMLGNGLTRWWLKSCTSL